MIYKILFNSIILLLSARCFFRNYVITINSKGKEGLRIRINKICLAKMSISAVPEMCGLIQKY